MQGLARPFNTLFWLLGLLYPGAKPSYLVDFSAFVGTTLLQGLVLALLLLPAFDLLEQLPIVLFDSYCLGVLRAKHLFSDGQGALEERLGLLVLALVPVEVCQVVKRACCVGVLRAKHFFSGGQDALVKGLGLLVLALVLVEGCQVVKRARCVGVLGAKHLFCDGQDAPGERFGLLVLAPDTVEDCQVVEQVIGVGMIDPVPFLPMASASCRSGSAS